MAIHGALDIACDKDDGKFPWFGVLFLLAVVIGIPLLVLAALSGVI